MKSFKIAQIRRNKQKSKNIPCEELTEKALKWFYERLGWQVEEDIVNLYMARHNIRNTDVIW